MTYLIALPVKSGYDEIRQSLAACARVGVPASYSPADLFAASAPSNRVTGHYLAPVMSMSATPSPGAAGHQARNRRRSVRQSVIVVVAPVIVAGVVAIAIKLTSAGPVLFAQDRYGKQQAPVPRCTSSERWW